MKVIKIQKIGKGTPTDPFRPAFISADGKRFGESIPGITYTVIEEKEDSFIIEIDESALEQLIKHEIKFEEL